MQHRRNVIDFKRLPLVVAMAACLYGTAAFAQSSDEDEDSSEKASELERITVTGSLLKRAEFESIAPIQVVRTEAAFDVGRTDTADMLQQSSVAAGSFQLNNQFSGFVVEGGTGAQSLDLRGLGAGRTLILLNGHRPGPAGTRGQVLAFDLNVLPSSILERAEIVKDGSSSIYGSDAVAGVVNLITRTNIDKPEFSISSKVPFGGGAEVWTASAATGWNFDAGSIVLAGEYYLHEPLKFGDRDYLSCAQDLIRDRTGQNYIDREDRSVLAGTSLGGCTSGNLYANTIIDALTGQRYIPSPDGVTIGPFPGYRPRVNPTYANSPQAAYEDVLNFDFMDNAQLIDRQERVNVYAAANFTFDNNVNWNSELLYNNRQTRTNRYRQFFPAIDGDPGGYANDPDFTAPLSLSQPIMPFPSKQNVEVDYVYVATTFDGYLPFGDTWTWQAHGSYSRSDGDYNPLAISGARSGDFQYTDDAPSVNYFDPCFLSGQCMDELVAAVGQWDPGNTVYEQAIFNAVVTGELFQMPAGAAGAAFGVEFRDYSIDDQPGALSQSGDLWGQSSAQVTKGDDQVKEVFAELELPLLSGLPAIESLTANISARAFDYDSVDDSDHVWKIGLGWQIVPSVRLRATKGTSYRAPGLYELYLGNQSGFVSQLSIDPCIEWGESTNDFIRANCAAAGIPDNFVGGGSSAEVFQGGGAGFLTPETSKAFTAGLIWTPEFAPISVALDYFEYEVRDQIGELDEGTILLGCYASPVYPNNFCDLFTRNPGTGTNPYAIDEVYATYVNINQQKTKGYDLIARYDADHSFGGLEIEAEFTYTRENFYLLFEDPTSGGLTRADNTGSIGNPKLVGNIRAALTRGDWTYTWFMDYVSSTRNLDLTPIVTYSGYQGAVRDIVADAALYHTASVRYNADDWSVLFGVNNVFDRDPPTVSTGAATRYGNIPAFATQYDLYGRSLFARFTYQF